MIGQEECMECGGRNARMEGEIEHRPGCSAVRHDELFELAKCAYEPFGLCVHDGLRAVVDAIVAKLKPGDDLAGDLAEALRMHDDNDQVVRGVKGSKAWNSRFLRERTKAALDRFDRRKSYPNTSLDVVATGSCKASTEVRRP